MKKSGILIISFLLVQLVIKAQSVSFGLLSSIPASTSATVQAKVSGIVTQSSIFSVTYGESATNLNKSKLAGVTFGSGALLLSNFTLGITIDSLKQQTKYYFKYVFNDSYIGITNRFSLLDSFTTTKEPLTFILSNTIVHDSSKVNTFIGKFISNDLLTTTYTIPAGLTVDNKYFYLKRDSLFTNIKFDSLKAPTYSIKINAVFSDNSTTISTFSINVLDKTPPVITLKVDTVQLYLNPSSMANVTIGSYNNGTSDNRVAYSMILSQYDFDCSHVGVNRLELKAYDTAGNVNLKYVYANVKDTIKPSLYVKNEKNIYMDSLGVAKISSSEIETKIAIPDSLFNGGLIANFTLDNNFKNVFKSTVLDTTYSGTNNGAVATTDRFNRINGAYSFNGLDQAINLGNSFINVTKTNPYSISFWAKTAYAPREIVGFGSYQDYNGHRYFKSNNKITWNEAKRIADSLKGYLAIPNNSLENNFLTTLAGGVLTWIGVTDEKTEGTWLDIFDKSVGYFNWKAGQPDNFNNEDYVHLSETGQWNDGPNSYLLNYIIEFDINTGVMLSKYQNLDAAGSSFFITPTSVSGNGTNSITYSAPDSNWNHYLIVFADGVGNTKVFRNGQVLVKSTLTYSTLTTATPVYLGRVSGSPSNFYKGSIDDLRFYNKVLTDTQILNLYLIEKLNYSDRVYSTFDNCAIVKRTFTKESFTCNDLGKTTTIYSIIDKGGNKVDSLINVTVIDTIRPIIKVKNVTLKLDNTATFKLAYTDFDDGSVDNCSIASRTLSKTDFNLKDTGDNKITYTIIDKSGNSTSKEVTIKFACKEPVAPSAQSISFCQNSTGNVIVTGTPTGGSSMWYNSISGGTGSTLAPTIPTSTLGSTDVFVSNTFGGCESARSKITINIKVGPTKSTITRDTSGFLVSSSLNDNFWFKDGVALSDSLQKYKPNSSGSFQVKNTSNGCSVFSEKYYFIITDIINLSSTEFIKLSPNPFVNKVNFDFNIKGYQKLNIEVIDFATGNKLNTKESLSSGIPIYLGQLPSGIYIIHVFSSDNKISYYFKMIKI